MVAVCYRGMNKKYINVVSKINHQSRDIWWPPRPANLTPLNFLEVHVYNTQQLKINFIELKAKNESQICENALKKCWQEKHSLSR